MRLLIVTGSLFNQQSGPFLSVLSLAKALLGRGHEVTVIGSQDKRGQTTLPYAYESLVTEYPKLQILALPKFGPYNLHYTPSIKKKVARQKAYDAVLIQGIWQWNCWWVFWFAYTKKVTSLISIRGEIVDSESLAKIKKRLFMPWIKFMLNRVDFVHVLNKREKKSVEDLGIKSKIKTIPNGVFSRSEKAPRIGKNILFLGRLHPIKNLLAMVEGWKLAHLNTWTLTIAGSGDKAYENSLRHAAGDDDSIIFMGPVFDSEKHTVFKNADWFILPSLNEGMPMAVLEALSFGIPVIISAACNLDQVLEEGAGILTGLSAKEIGDSFGKVFRMAENHSELMGKNAIAVVESYFDWMKIAGQIEDLITN